MDYDGTVVNFGKNRELVYPPKELLNLLKKFIDNKVFVAILSGRTKEDLEVFFKDIPITLAAEHGAFVKRPNSSFEGNFDWVDTSFKEKVKKVLSLYKDRIPNSEIEEKQYSIVFHLKSEDEVAELASRELLDILIQLTANLNAHVMRINKGIEIRAQEISKGAFVSKVAKEGYDFLLIAGDDAVDEDAFRVGNKYGYTVKVGKKLPTFAKFYVNSTEEFNSVLEALSDSIKLIKSTKESLFVKLLKNIFKT